MLKKITIKDALIQRIDNQIKAQTDKGIEKYGHSLDDCKYSKYDWLEMANQELIDLAQYQQKEIRRLREKDRMIERALEDFGI